MEQRRVVDKTLYRACPKRCFLSLERAAAYPLQAGNLGSADGESPGYCLHKPTEQAYVKLNRGVFYRGKHGSAENREKDARLIAKYLRNAARRNPRYFDG